MGIPAMATRDDAKNIKRLKDMPMALFVGDSDNAWKGTMQEQVAELKKAGAQHITLEVVPNQGHVVRGWEDGQKLFSILKKWRQKLGND